jgi:hypothetical protein
MLTILSSLLSSASSTTIIYFLILLGLSGALLYEHHQGFQACANQAAQQSLVIKDKQLEISTHRPDLDALLKRMYAGTE